MLAITLEAARNIGTVAVIGLVMLAVASAVAIKNITTKIVMVVILGGFALGVWTQRAALQDCASKVKADVAAEGDQSATCTFFGTEVKIDLPG